MIALESWPSYAWNLQQRASVEYRGGRERDVPSELTDDGNAIGPQEPERERRLVSLDYPKHTPLISRAHRGQDGDDGPVESGMPSIST
jgi:hypothetical protein